MKNKITPKVKFKVQRTIETLGTIWYFLNPDNEEWDWKDKVLNKYPILRSQFYKTKDIDKRKKIISKFFLDFEKNNIKKIIEKREQFQKAWKRINDKYIRALSEVVEIDWPKDCEKITAWITVNPICPRDIQKRSLDIFFKQK